MDLGGYINMEEKKTRRRRNASLDWHSRLDRYRTERIKRQTRLEKEAAAIELLDKAIEETERLAIHDIINTYKMTPEQLEEALKERNQSTSFLDGNEDQTLADMDVSHQCDSEMPFHDPGADGEDGFLETGGTNDPTHLITETEVLYEESADE